MECRTYLHIFVCHMLVNAFDMSLYKQFAKRVQNLSNFFFALLFLMSLFKCNEYCAEFSLLVFCRSKVDNSFLFELKNSIINEWKIWLNEWNEWIKYTIFAAPPLRYNTLCHLLVSFICLHIHSFIHSFTKLILWYAFNASNVCFMFFNFNFHFFWLADSHCSFHMGMPSIWAKWQAFS